MGKLNRTPEGFLDWTGQRVGGRYPTEISDVVAPTVDVSDFLGGRLIAAEQGSFATSAVGDSVTLTVPQNENWLLFGVSCFFISTAGVDDVRWQIVLTNLPGSSSPANIIPIQAPFDTAPGLNVIAVNGPPALYFARPIPLSPGCQIVYTIVQTNAVGNAWTAHAGVYKLQGN